MALEILVPVIAVIVFVLVAAFVWHIFGKLIKFLLWAAIIFGIIIAINAVFVYKDVMDLRQNFAHSTKKVILMDDGKALTGLLLNGETEVIGESELNKISLSIENKGYKSALGSSYKLIIFDIKAISNLNEEISIGQTDIRKDEAIFTLRSGSESEKADLFEAILENNILTSDNPVFFFSQIKEGNIKVYQETALFKAAKVLPLGTVKSIARDIFEKGRETAKAFVVEG